jgi:hypothetical protein
VVWMACGVAWPVAVPWPTQYANLPEQMQDDATRPNASDESRWLEAKTENKRHTAVTANTPAMNQLAQCLTLDKPSGNGSSGV